MKKFILLIVFLGASLTVSSFNHLEKNDLMIAKNNTVTNHINSFDVYDFQTVNVELLNDFFKRYPNLKQYQNEVASLYKNRSYEPIWFQDNSINALGQTLYQKLKNLDQEGLAIKLPYKKDLDLAFGSDNADKLSESDTDMLLSTMYVIYMSNVYEGIDAETVKKSGWLLPKKKISYVALLDSLMTNPALLEKNNDLLIPQYYKLQEVLKKYQKIEQDKTWTPIAFTAPYKDLRPDATSEIIRQVRNRLFLLGDLATDSGSDFYDRELMDGVMKYKLRNGLTPNYIIKEEHIQQLNVPIAERIKTLMINMERSRWISPKMIQENEFVMVNVPSFMLKYVKNGKTELESNVFVGASYTKTTIFSGKIDKIVFSPYWYIPQSIVENELKMKIAADPNYLTDHNMEIVNGQMRQNPGPDNSLGLVKFIFPNGDDIYMHDTPAKTLFEFERRTFSHGCINVKKAKELAIAMLQDYPEWSPEKVDTAMAGVTEKPFKLATPIPIYISYFTAWVNENGEVGFYQDVYEHDNELSSALFPQDIVALN
ncbi:L,D-transpeptidase family protein [Flavobacterium sp. GA093]|uniref:L,D-transpeptidase family protein n=1 Tax=Flavobacterium hydrocarbonoxydans TaxID=2683249 RepID=A0A6I4NRA9_9FLAO|nr:L,D-transpeptidase family protein [Flavobacterium hydrocarbonoxydans]MWB95522.1 L,D-transpeptidase family protein [Flavobacterium hydrocarbonoxydans]